MAAKAGRLQIQLEMQVAKLQQDLAKANRSIENSASKWAKSFATVGAAFAGALVAGAVMEGIGQLNQALDDTLARMDSIADGAKRVGLGAEEFQELSYAAEQSGLSMEALEKSLVKMQRGFGEATKGFKEALDDIGLSFDALAGQTDKEQFIAIVDALGKVEDNGKRAAAGAALLGKGFSALGPLMDEGREGIERMIDSAHRLGIVMSEETIQAGEAFNDQVDTMKLQLQALIAQGLTPLLPQLQAISEELGKSAAEFLGASNNAEAFRIIANTLADGLLSLANVALQTASGMAALKDILTAPADPWDVVSGQTSAAIEQAFAKNETRVQQIEAMIGRAREAIKSIQNTKVVPTSSVDYVNGKWVDATKAGSEATEDDTKKTDRNTAAVERNTEAKAKNTKEKQAQFDLQKLLEGSAERAEQMMARTDDLLTQRTMAQQESLGMSREELEVLDARMRGYSESQIVILRDIQAIRLQGEEREKQAQKLQQYSQFAEASIHEIFGAMTEGADAATDAVIRLVAELTAAFITAKALQAFGLPGTGGMFQANGGVFPSGVQTFAQGGIVRGPTAFRFGGSRLGVMGEAGPEAIMPLGRDSQGRLGVRGGGVKVSVHNYNGSDIRVEDRGGDVAVIVDQVRSVIANDIARGGSLIAGSLEGAYRLRR